MNIYQRLNAVMKAVSYVQKEDKKVNNQYTFVSHDAVTAKVRQHFIDNGIVMTTDVKEVKQDGNRTEAYVVLRFVNIEKPEDYIAITCFGFGIDPQDKGPGKAVSYAVKYGILKTLCLETGDDPERDQINHAPDARTEARQTVQHPDNAFGDGDPQPDAEIIAQLNAAKDTAGLTKVMNSLSQGDKKLYTGHFNQCMANLKKAA